ncbi:MAG: hypothetical protein O3A46_04850 [Candidatus Poribacteria bacterium]|nr:hypothetical protein [Candidatus Poribacteria bacterium]
MRRLPTNSRRATEELWGELEKRLETARRAYGDAPREVMAHQLELHRDTLDRWNDGDLLNPQFPMSMDVFVVGFENEMGPNLASHLRGIGLRADDSPDNRVAYATMKAYHTRAVVFDARRPSPATFVDMTTERQPHVKCIAVGDPNDREVVERLRTRGAAAFIPLNVVDVYRGGVNPFDTCVKATLTRQEKACPHFEAGGLCRGECGVFESAADRSPMPYRR